MNVRRRDLFVFILFLIITFAWRRQRRPAPAVTPPPVAEVAPTARSTRAPPPRPGSNPPRATTKSPVTHASIAAPTAPAPAADGSRRAPKGLPVVPFVIEDGVAVSMGDVVMGKPARAEPGLTTMAKLQPWTSDEIAFHVQPDLPNPERVLQALRLFEGTPIRFVPLTTQEDALVFEPGTGACKSYLGRIGGKQPIWLSPGCGPTEIAHEILHALGFIHE
jgi:hypothetical protein